MQSVSESNAPIQSLDQLSPELKRCLTHLRGDIISATAKKFHVSPFWVRQVYRGAPTAAAAANSRRKTQARRIAAELVRRANAALGELEEMQRRYRIPASRSIARGSLSRT